jgi:arylsulfatase A-like enzyme
MGVNSCSPTSTPPPNVLFMIVDDLNDWVGCLGGHPETKTPNIDRLTSRGVLFTNAHCAAPACGPSRAAALTGIRPSTSGIYSNNQPFRKSPVLENAVTLPQHFMNHGYSAMGSGKIYHGIHPDPLSWNEYWPSEYMTRPPDPMPDDPPLNGIPNTSHFDWGAVDVPVSGMGDSKVADWISGQLAREHEAPFFLACGFYRPHLPWYVPQKYFDMFPLDSITLPNVNDDDLSDVPAAGKKMAGPDGDHAKVLKYGQWKKAVQGYLASIAFADDCVGKVLDALDKSPHKDNTVIVFCSDHGWHLGEKLHWRKFALWEEATHNNLAIVAPGITEENTRCEAAVNLIDIYPTLIDLCGLGENPALEGESLVPLLKDTEQSREHPSLTTRGRNNHSLRTERWRYIRYADGSEELYDHDTDEMEWTNLADSAEYADVKEDLSRWLPEGNAENSLSENNATIRKNMEAMGIQLP